MPTLYDIGGFDYRSGIAVATLSYTPPADRAAILHRINLSQVSAKDNWILTVGQRELMRFRHSTVGSQQLLEAAAGLPAPNLDFFTYCKDQLGMPADIAVPNGLTATFASAGGATGDVLFESEEVTPDVASVPGLNHPFGTHFLVPMSFFLAASTTTVGVQQVDTQVGPLFMPNLFAAQGLPVNWGIRILALWMEGVGVNTFSGAANHQSTTQSFQLKKNNTVLWTRTLNGIPNRGKASALGSANTVLGQEAGLFPPFALSDWTSESKLRVPITLRGGDFLQISLETQGDLTGGASYVDAILNAIVDVQVPSSAGLM